MSTKFGNVSFGNEYFDLDDEHVNRDRQQILEEFERKKKVRQITVSVDDVEVRAHLREINEPICLFGEGPADRRERLRQLLAKLGQDAIRKKKNEDESEDKERHPTQTWYHEGPESLRRARYWIADYSIPRAKERLERARQERMISESTKTAINQQLYKKLRMLQISCSQICDTRPVAFATFSPDSSIIATASWSGLCKLWSAPDLQHIRTLRGHNCNARCITFHPQSTQSLSPTVLNLASSATDGSVNLWNLESEEPIGSLEGHENHRVSRIAFHPSGRFLATCCSDKSWRLFDMESNQEVLYQEGHSKEVFDISFQCDGSLAATGGLDAFGRVWDLRTGRCIMFMEGHLKGILSICFSPNGYQVVTGSEDHSVKIWNVRQRKCEYTIPAHTNVVSKVLFEKNFGNYILSASFDNTLKLWAHPAWTPIQTLSGHDNKIMCADMTPDNQYFVTSSYDRTFKLWTPE
ncbi:U4/U6 small nuclear ribonucleoprotein Prp4-like protein [Dinothrombium tinctorium]|uniref:U4/U6 small nuclear ribonucleoprotein Prp4-like protein n=1 Tax=Dinothrombium tinctorium TaxID=1965070 RepID=A0A443QWR6_9ACAR|nr:U4/U6 small nuclear ribonucleoprotein Prp4-like protein [Dinothrombium tinctorium]RWS07449.1 U4/U6 small nuclear ribonucleoprotein Prp4-like protein [Dinothrombium tinctorium]RWS08095.1 U4/U6 small nuclear ribonucleoprotein Prp4-like protein [Dinothrombium tinctorium]